jgi:CHASE1-domain containing sensor protein
MISCVHSQVPDIQVAGYFLILLLEKKGVEELKHKRNQIRFRKAQIRKTFRVESKCWQFSHSPYSITSIKQSFTAEETD